MSKRAFSFLEMPPRSEKPRVNGLTMCIDQGLGFGFVEDLLEMSADYIDLWKLGWTTTQLQPLELVKKKINLLRSYEISVCNGGTLLELSEQQGKSSELFKELIDMGCDSTEISSGSSDIGPERIIELISEAKAHKLRVFCEVGKKLPEEDYEAEEYNKLLKTFISAGADKVILEARESGVSVGVMDDDGNPRVDRLDKVLGGINASNILFESPKKSQQVFFLKKFGPETSLGNIHPNDAISVETLRRGMRGDTMDDFYFVIADRHLKKQGSQ
jgi:phosphosulfolactate synthase